jgi:hypothetical protein
MPLIAAPADDAERRINAALKKLDEHVLKAAAGCKGEKHAPAVWDRGVDVTMHGPAYLSYTITDSIDCAGAHPDSAIMSIVYDLRTGAPVDWTRLLPATLTGTIALEGGEDGTKMVTLASKRLWSLYWMAYQASHKDDESCSASIKELGANDPPPMMVWLAGASGSLGLTFNVPHAVLACADEMTVPSATLHQEGAALPLIEALEAARAGSEK